MLKMQTAQGELLIEKGKIIYELVEKQADKEHIYAVIINGKLHDLRYCVQEGGSLRFVYAKSETGRLIYERTLLFLLIAAAHEYRRDLHIIAQHSLSEGVYCDVRCTNTFTPLDVVEIEKKMKAIIARKESIYRKVVSTKEAAAYFEAKGMLYKADMLAQRKSKKSSIYTLCGVDDYFYGIMLPDTSYLKEFSICFYKQGIWLSAQGQFTAQTKLFQVFQEYEAWGRLVGISNVAQLNKRILNGDMNDLVLMSETMVEKKLAQLADQIVHRAAPVRCVLIAGPSSAGKTTFSKRLSIHLQLLGKQPVAISMDDFYVNRTDTPKNADGSYNFEALEAVDLTLFQHSINALLKGEEVVLPRYDFQKGVRTWHTKGIRLKRDDILIIEGIHGLNPKTSEHLPPTAIFKIYINAFTHLNLDDHNRIPTSDYRLIRRIARDYQFRGWSAEETIASWKSVRDGEDTYIYPYQEEADVFFNSSMIYELSILKKLVIPLLEAIPKESAAYLEANRLSKLLEYFADGDEAAIPRHSILAEFIGNSIFDL